MRKQQKGDGILSLFFFLSTLEASKLCTVDKSEIGHYCIRLSFVGCLPPLSTFFFSTLVHHKVWSLIAVIGLDRGSLKSLVPGKLSFQGF